jgi:threonine/homoserine/homoserine lactone efflux protein
MNHLHRKARRQLWLGVFLLALFLVIAALVGSHWAFQVVKGVLVILGWLGICVVIWNGVRVRRQARRERQEARNQR